jgi:hypothetical protein
METPKMPPLNKRAEFLAFMVWIALIAAIIILIIDYSIKQSILDSAQQAKGMLDAVKRPETRSSDSASATGSESRRMRGDADTQMEVGVVPTPLASNGRARQANGRFAKPQTGNDDPGISGPSEPVQP